VTVDLGGILADGRSMVADLMQDQCTITRPGTPGDLNQQTGQHEPGVPTHVYAGPCRLKAPVGVNASVDEEAGELEVSASRYQVAIPFDAATPIEPDDVVTITAVSAYGDPWLVDRSFVVTDIGYSSTSTARKLSVEEAS